MRCPKCQSKKVRGTDMSPLYFPEKSECEKQGYDMGVDNYVHMEIVCDSCNHAFNKDFFFPTDYTNADNERLNIILDSLEPTSDLYKTLKKVIQTLGSVKNNSDICNEPIKTKTMKEKPTYNVNEILRSVEVIESSEELTEIFRKEYGTEFGMIKACVKDNLIKPKAIRLIETLAPTVYKINGKLFLKGEEKGEHDFIGDGLDHQTAIELFDITEEMRSGHSYSFYVSNTYYFELATPEEHIKVKEFLENL
jgi:hypothetical protein